MAQQSAFDPVYESTVNTINKNLAGLQSSRDLGIQRTTEDYDKQVGETGKSNERTLNALQEKLANQGIRHSGINVAEQGKVGEQYQTQLASLAQNKQRSLEDIARDFTTRQAGYQDQLAQAEASKAEKETERQKQIAADEAQATSAKTMADQQRQWMADLQAQILQQVQPQPTPTGQMKPPPPQPQAIIQKAIAQVPPPAAKTPQQQVLGLNIDPKQLQVLLRAKGYDPGPIDGAIGIKTQQALARYKQSIGLPATADINLEIWQGLLPSGPDAGQRAFDIMGP